MEGFGICLQPARHHAQRRRAATETAYGGAGGEDATLYGGVTRPGRQLGGGHRRGGNGEEGGRRHLGDAESLKRRSLLIAQMIIFEPRHLLLPMLLG